MPDIVTHFYFGEKVYKYLNQEIKNHIHKELFQFTTAGPDPFFFYKFLRKEKNKKVREIGNRMHKENTSDFFINLIEKTNELKNKDLLFSYLCGFITHFALDSYAHPYIFHKTGIYYEDDSKDITYRGLHTKLERAIDCFIIKNHFQTNPYTFKIHKRILKLKSLPLELFDPLDDVFYKTYGYENISTIIDETIKDQRKFYKFIYDPFGFKNLIFKAIDKKTTGLDYTVLSYYGKEVNNIDILNTKRNLWNNPIDENIISDDSFFALLEKSLQYAIKLIDSSYKYLFINEQIDLYEIFENKSYLTGLDVSLGHDMKYFNNIFSK